MSSAGDPITLPWKLNPPVFDGDSLKFRSFRKEATTFADCCGLAMSSRATVNFLLQMGPSRTRRLDHAVTPTLKFRDTARPTSSCVQLSVQKTEVSCCERIPPLRLGIPWSHGITLSPSLQHKLSMTVFSHIPRSLGKIPLLPLLLWKIWLRSSRSKIFPWPQTSP